MKRLFTILLSIALITSVFCSIGCAPSVSQEEFDKVVAEKDSLSAQVSSLQGEKTALQTKYDALQDKYSMLEDEKTTLQNTIDSAAAWFSLSDEEQSEMLVVLQEREAEREAQAAKEAQQGYETGITYDQLARTPDDYIGKKVKFRGIAIQVIEGSGTTMLRIATSGRYDNVILVQYDSTITSIRVLEDDKVTIYGTSAGLYTYESTGGGEITIPYILVDQIEFVS